MLNKEEYIMALFTNQMRFTGMSGLEVNDMVTQLMTAHSARLNRMRQQREIMVWQRDALRNVATDLRTFQRSFLSFEHNQSQNIRAVGNFSALSTNIVDRNNSNRTVRGVTVNPVDPNDTRARRVEVHAVAQGDIFRSAESLNRPITATRNLDVNGLSGVGGLGLRVELNGQTETVTISSSELNALFLNPDGSTLSPGTPGTTDTPANIADRAVLNERFVNLLNQRLRQTHGSDVGGFTNNLSDTAHGAHDRQHVWASLDGERLVIHARGGNEVSLSSGPNGDAWGHRLEMIGFNYTPMPGGTRVGPTTTFDPATTPMVSFLGQQTFSFEINGSTFAFSGGVLTVNGTMVANHVNPHNLTVQDVMNAVNNSNAGVRMSFSASTGRMTMESTQTGSGAGTIQFRDITGGFFNEIGLGSSHTVQANNHVQGGVNMNAFDFNRAVRGDTAFTLGDFTGGMSFTVNGRGFTADEDEVAAWASGAGRTDFIRDLNIWLNETFGRGGSTPNSVTPGSSATGMNPQQRYWAEFEHSSGRFVIRAQDGNTVTLGEGYEISGVPNRSLEMLGFTNPATPVTNRFTPENTTVGELLGYGPDEDFSFTINGAVFNFLRSVDEYGNPIRATDDDGAYIQARDGAGNLLFEAGGTTPVWVYRADHTSMTIAQLMNGINSATDNLGEPLNVRMTFDSITNRFRIESTDGRAPADIELSGSFFDRIGLGEDDRINVNASRAQAAADAIIYVDGQRFVRSTNNIIVEGIRINLDPSAIGNVSPDNPLDLDVTFERNTEAVVQLIRDFIDNYNELIRSIREQSETRRPRQSQGAGGGFYMPLTDDQRRDMSDREIELWEAQARTGILHRDDTLRRLTQDLHRAIFQDVQLEGGGTINLLDLGIRTSSDLNRFGELEIDERHVADGMTRLEYFVQNRSSDVTELFTNFSNIPAGNEPNSGRVDRIAEGGLGQRISDIMNWSMSYGGGFYDRVGARTHDGAPSENNRMNTRLAEHDRRIDNQLRILQRRETRYFQIFSRLEAAMIQANSQMMFMEQMFWMA